MMLFRKTHFVFLIIVLPLMASTVFANSPYAIEGNKVVHQKIKRQDGKSTVYERTLLEDVNSGNFKIINDFFVTSQHSVYFDGSKIPGADPKSFEVVLYNYSKDKNSAYYADRIIEDSTPNTFRLLAPDYSTDETYVFLHYRKLDGAVPQEFQILGYGYSKDMSIVWYLGNRIIEADARTFAVTANGIAMDKKYKYHEGKIERRLTLEEKNSFFSENIPTAGTTPTMISNNEAASIEENIIIEQSEETVSHTSHTDTSTTSNRDTTTITTQKTGTQKPEVDILEDSLTNFTEEISAQGTGWYSAQTTNLGYTDQTSVIQMTGNDPKVYFLSDLRAAATQQNKQLSIVTVQSMEDYLSIAAQLHTSIQKKAKETILIVDNLFDYYWLTFYFID